MAGYHYFSPSYPLGRIRRGQSVTQNSHIVACDWGVETLSPADRLGP